MAIDFKPEDVLVQTPLPFVGTFGRAESEFMAAILVLLLVKLDRGWSPIQQHEMGDIIGAAEGEEKKQFEHLYTNPFVRPARNTLVEDGYVMLLPTKDPKLKSMAFTEKGVERLRKWVRKANH